jgi:hypothetical protein
LIKGRCQKVGRPRKPSQAPVKKATSQITAKRRSTDQQTTTPRAQHSHSNKQKRNQLSIINHNGKIKTTNGSQSIKSNPTTNKYLVAR